MIDFWKSIVGMYEVEVTSASVEEALCMMNECQIPLYRVGVAGELSVRFFISRCDLSNLEKLCKKRGDTLRICRKAGIYWLLSRFGKRPVLSFGLSILVIAALYLPSRVLFIQVEGNDRIPGNRILEAAAQCGIQIGASRAEVRSEQIKNRLLSEIQELKWAGINTYGCLAVISVREHPPETEREEVYPVSSIVAARDGVITACTATSGNLLCREGQAVRQGEVLISAYTDCGRSIQATCAEGEIYAQTVRNLRAIKPLHWTSKDAITQETRKISLIIGKKRINLWKDSGIWDVSCGRMYQEYPLTLPGGYQLPVSVCLDTYLSYETTPSLYPEEDAKSGLTEFAGQYLLEHMVAGQICSSKLSLAQAQSVCVLEGEYICTEMIGKVQPEWIGEENGKTDGAHH